MVVLPAIARILGSSDGWQAKLAPQPFELAAGNSLGLVFRMACDG